MDIAISSMIFLGTTKYISQKNHNAGYIKNEFEKENQTFTPSIPKIKER